jgi:hypothetical protein
MPNRWLGHLFSQDRRSGIPPAGRLQCTFPELAEMAARARIEYTQHVCPIHRIHTLEDLENKQ